MPSIDRSHKYVDIFDHVSSILSDETGGPVFLIRITGPRWSYVAGFVPDELPFVPPVKVMLDAEWGILYYPEPGRKIDPEKVKASFLNAVEPDDES